MTSSYAAAVERLGWLVDAVETSLSSRAEGTELTSEAVRSACAGRLATPDEALVALNALSEIGVLGPPPKRRLSQANLASSAAYRAGIRDGLAARPRGSNPIRLCAAVPPGLTGSASIILRQTAEDLRGALMDMVAGAKTDLVLASPFWDDATMSDVAPLLSRRLESGVRLRILGRFNAGVPIALSQLAMRPRCTLLSWYESHSGDPFGSHTFHFKAAVADGGSRAYLGTANFTESGLRSRLEFGVLLEAEAAVRLATAVEAVLELATRVKGEA